jgi:hypothetical protein
MRKVAMPLVCILAMQFGHNSYAIDVETVVKEVGESAVDVASKCSQLSFEDKVWFVCDVIVLIYSLYGLYSVFVGHDRLMELKNKQEYDFLVAQQKLADSLKTNAGGVVGAYGIPQKCEQEMWELALLPGGEEALQKIIESYQKYYYSKSRLEIA